MDKSIEFFKGMIDCCMHGEGDPELEVYKECLAELHELRKKLEWQPMETCPVGEIVQVGYRDGFIIGSLSSETFTGFWWPAGTQLEPRKFAGRGLSKMKGWREVK